MCPASVEDLSQQAISTAVVYPLGATAGALRVNAALAARLTFDRREAHHLDLPLHPRGDARLPPIHQRWPAWKAELLQDGVVPAGAQVLREHILAADPVEGEALFTAAKEAMVERSERIRDRDALPEGVAERIMVVVRWPAPLEIGDILLAGGRALGVVEAILDDGLEEPRIDPGPGYMQGEVLEVTRQLPTAAERMEARSIGPYSVQNELPVSGQQVLEAHLFYLARRGCFALCDDLTVTKSDSPQARLRAFEALTLGLPLPGLRAGRRRAGIGRLLPLLPPPGLPAPLRYLGSLLRAFGISLALEEGTGLRLSLDLPEGTPWSSGEVIKPETLNYEVMKPEPGGLLCQRIFGPVQDYTCACGDQYQPDLLEDERIIGYDVPIDTAETCPRCGVPFVSARARRVRLGHISLGMYVLPWHLRPLVGALLDEDPQALLAAATQDGGAALRARLASVGVSARAAAARGDTRRLLEGFVATGLPAERLLWSTVPVIPPGLRPVVPMGGGLFASSDLNDLYRRLIARSNRLRRAGQIGAPAELAVSERRLVQEAFDRLFANHALPPEQQSTDDNERPLMDLTDMAAKELREPRVRRVDYSGCATAIVEPRPDGRCAVPRTILLELFRPMLEFAVNPSELAELIWKTMPKFSPRPPLDRDPLTELLGRRPLLFMRVGVPGDAPEVPVGAAFAVVEEHPVIRLDAGLSARLGVKTGDGIAVHLPLSDPAVEEARWLAAAGSLGTFPGAPPRPAEGEGSWLRWLREAPDFTAALVDLALERTLDPCTWPPAAALAGGYLTRPHRTSTAGGHDGRATVRRASPPRPTRGSRRRGRQT